MAGIALVTGSFDPITRGHVDIIERAVKLFDKVYVGVFYNPNKSGLFELSDRLSLVAKATSHLPNVEVVASNDQLAVELARQYGITHLVRGLRDGQDLAYEANLAYFNHALAPEIETVYLLARHELQPISSSRVRELLHFGQDCSPYLPAVILKDVEELCHK